MIRLLLILLLLLPSLCEAQTYGNEWINYNQQYYSFKIHTNGIYRIDYNTLSNAGVPLGSIQTENFQLFGKEKEQPIHIEDGGDSSFDPGDYFLFYAERNDSWLDSLLYDNPNSVGNPMYSLYNDTLIYFFTWNAATNNLRYQVETDVNFAAYASSANYIISKVEKNANSEYHDGIKISEAASSFFMPGEGWGAAKVNGAATTYTANLTLTTNLPYLGGVQAEFRGLSVSNSDATYTGLGNHHLRWVLGATNQILLDTVFVGYNQVICSKTFDPSILTNGSTPVKWKIIADLGVASDYQAYSYYSIKYPRLPNFAGSNNMDFYVVNDPQGKIKLDITNAGYANPIMLVHGDTPLMVPFVPNGGIHSVLIPNSSNGSNQKVIYRDSSLIVDVSGLTPVNGTSFFTDFTAVPGSLEDALLFIYHDSLLTATMNYAAYRQSAAGGNYNVVMANIYELYLQFGGGIEKHIMGPRRFAHFVFNNSVNKPQGLFLVGKGIREANYNSTLTDGPGARKNVTRFHNSLIPSFGQPSSDVCITSNLEGWNKWLPLIPTGRISARTNTELQGYLDKVIAHDSNQDPTSIYDSPNKDWQKHIIHFAGGSDLQQQGQFQAYMNALENTIEDSLFGGEVMRVYKTSSDPLDPTVLASVTDRISEGVSLMSYFGHASPTTSGFEINLDDPSNWNNTGKYPLMMVNSCYNGNIFQQSYSKSEDVVQLANFGAIGYIASVSVGFDISLYSYSNQLYKQIAELNYGKTIGEQMKATIEAIETPGGSLITESTCTQLVLNGDPMVKVNWHQKPEIELLPERVSFTPNQFNLTVDSIEMHINLVNLGRSVTDTFNLEVIRDFPGSNTDSIYNFQIPKLDYTSDFSFKMPLQANIGVGINNFTVRVDLPSNIVEQYDDLNNNQIVKSLFINIDGIVPVMPYEFAVVPNDSVVVKASTINPIADFNTYRFELDTTDLFDSPEHRFAIVTGLGGVKEVLPSQWISTATGLSAPLICQDSAVYFWRVAIDSVSPDWRESSFQYIQGKQGWGQDHFFQFKNNGFFGVDYDRPSRTRQFGLYNRQLLCDVFASTATPTIYYNAWYMDNDLQDYGICDYTPKLHVGVIDPVTLDAWGTRYVPTAENLGNNFGNNNDNGACLPRVMKFFTFNQNDLTRLNSFQDMVLNQVPDGHYLLIYAPIKARYDWWNSIDSLDMYATFAALGSDSINGSRPNTPFAFFCQKGDTNSVIELFAPTATDDVHLIANLIGNAYEGQENSPLIGPATNWGNVYWKQDPLEASTLDSTMLTIKVYDASSSFQFQVDTLFTSIDSILNLNGLIDATMYPFINLSAHYIDTGTNTPAQIDRWHVLFDPVPEAAIDGSNQYTWSIMNDTLDEGQMVEFAVDIRNIFTVDMDSLLVNYWIENSNQQKVPIFYDRQDSLRVNETLRDTITFSTVGLQGINSLWVEVNPYLYPSYTVTDQPEQEHFNNLLQIPFYVKPDDKNPILDVTFNGTHILNGDIIDPNSEVLITLKDDNEFLIMDNVSDTTLFGVYLTNPQGVQTRIPFINNLGETVMQWIPADVQNKKFKIIWPAAFTSDGTYTLFVQGSDRSGNLSGDIEYKISFEIVHESTITHMMNYPNPFSTSTRFVFTLTGSEAPDDIIIQIMTVSGRVVREITEDQLGPISIGRNISTYAWDGTDEFGDPLANGVYLYTVKARINGEEIKHRESGADTYFKKNFGKMYLMR